MRRFFLAGCFLGSFCLFASSGKHKPEAKTQELREEATLLPANTDKVVDCAIKKMQKDLI